MHLKAAKIVLRYIKGTSDYGFKFEKVQNTKLCEIFESGWIS